MIATALAWVMARLAPLLGIALVAACIGLGVQRIEIAHLETKVAQAETQLQTERAAAATRLADALVKAAAETHAMQEKANAAITQANQRAQAKNRALADARAQSDGLRGDLASVPDRIRDASDAAVREYAAAASLVLADCQARYIEVADKAAGHASDVQLLLDAWPVQPPGQQPEPVK